MNDEIKEILHEMKQMCDVWVKVDGSMKSYNQDQIHKIYEYITNLQEENERLKDFNIKLQATKDRLDKYDKENTLRIEKAVEYIKEHNMIVVNKEYIPDGISTSYDYELMNILNGRSDE